MTNENTKNGKVIKLSTETYIALRKARRELDLDSFNQTVGKLLEEHEREVQN